MYWFTLCPSILEVFRIRDGELLEHTVRIEQSTDSSEEDLGVA
ncbi:hypothetical protein [Sphingobacterium faecale]|nr:hypothetical protein [Sphingobacterium faecale]